MITTLSVLAGFASHLLTIASTHSADPKPIYLRPLQPITTDLKALSNYSSENSYKEGYMEQTGLELSA
jgi:hypothetical protein